jgi:hypothetical protein
VFPLRYGHDLLMKEVKVSPQQAVEDRRLVYYKLRTPSTYRKVKSSP